jgi:rubredoxin
MTTAAQLNPRRDLIRAFVNGGFLSPADLLKIMDISRSLGNSYIHFGSRQDIMFPANGAGDEAFGDSFRALNIYYELGSDQTIHQNIITSYVSVNITETTQWLKEDTYHVIIDGFDYSPRLKINIVDPLQGIVPLFTGELNFIASKEENYWYLFVRDARKGNLVECWPRLVFGLDIPRVAREIEKLFLNYLPFTVEQMYMMFINEFIRIRYKPITEKLRFSAQTFPYYEGINSMLNGQYWLGLYWRDNAYDIDFMSAACRLCQETNISKINLIPWKAFIIKGLKAADRVRWEKVMGKFGINERHSSLELNWHLPLLDTEALELKRFLVRELDQQDISTHGLTFTIRTHREMIYFTNIVIEKNVNTPVPGEHWDILYARNFNPGSLMYITYARAVDKEMIPALLIELSKRYFRQLNPEKESTGETVPMVAGATPVDTYPAAYQCVNCLTIYDEQMGDELAGIPAGAAFADLPDTYVCHVCGAGKREFTKV